VVVIGTARALSFFLCDSRRSVAVRITVTVQHKVDISLDGQTDRQTDRQHLAVLTKSVSWFKKVVTRNVFVSAPRRSLRR